jgi:hypothetical protein
MRQHMSLLLHAHITYNGTTLTLTLTDTITNANASFNHLDGDQYSSWVGANTAYVGFTPVPAG